MVPATKLTSLLVVLGLAITAHAQNARRAPTTLLKFSLNPAGELTLTIPFSLSASRFAKTEFSVKAESGTLRITCKWEPSDSLEVSVTEAAGHGLPGHIGLASQIGQSPVNLEAQVEPEQAARGPVFIEIARVPFQGRGAAVVHGTIVASMVAGGTEKVDGQERIRSAIQQGKLLSPSEVSAMEGKLQADPHDWSTRLSLLAYYASSAELRMSKPLIVAARRRHILWVIENRAAATDIFDMPELQINKSGHLADPEGAKVAEQAWQRAFADHTQDQQVLLNAALFSVTVDPAFGEQALRQAKSRDHDDARWDLALGWLYATAMLSGVDAAFAEHARSALTASESAPLLTGAAPLLAKPELDFLTTPQPQIRFSRPKYIDLAEELAARAVSLEPQNPYCLWSLLQVLSVGLETAETPDQKMVAGKKVFGLFQHFNDIAVDSTARTLLLPVLANLAFDVKDYEAAKTYAMQALDLASQQGDRMLQGVAVGPQAIHDANDLLGRVALNNGSLQQAKEYLLNAANIPAGGSLSRVGPRMLLAQALLERSERDVVLQYLEKIRTPWKDGNVALDNWVAAIKLGKPARLNLVDTPISAFPR